MNNLIASGRYRREIRWRLLSTVSAAVLLASTCATANAEAASGDSDRPSLWIDLGWQFERVAGDADPYAPHFITSTPRPGFETVSPLSLENTLPYSYGADGKISFEPAGTDWVFSASVRFGRSHGRKTMHQQTATHYTSGVVPYAFADTKVSNSETHAILDFQAGRDLGLGLFGREGSSVLSFGVRFAQFNAQSDIKISENPKFYPSHRFRFHEFGGTAHNMRGFRGVGPSVAWNASAALAGNPQDGEVTFDWGANAALLFGRQKADVHHRTHEYYAIRSHYVSVYEIGGDPSRRRSVTVPNLGGFAGISFRYTGARLSLSYRADTFFGALDGGMDAGHNVTRSFYGPFASISVGLGD